MKRLVRKSRAAQREMEDDFDDDEIEDPTQLSGGGGGGKEEEKGDDDDVGRPEDALQMGNAELIENLERRGLPVKGFPADDARTLQEALDLEYEQSKEERKKEAAEKRAREKKQAGLQRKRMIMEKQLKEEQEEVAKDFQTATWLDKLRRDGTESSARIDVNSIAVRALAKVRVGPRDRSLVARVSALRARASL